VLFQRSQSRESLSSVHSSVSIPRGVGRLRRFFAFAGPAYLVSVGYMDPGNWATDLEGGARFGYDLIWVLLMSNIMAVLFQTLAARLGIVTGQDLAQACRKEYERKAGLALWVLAELAIAACDLAEILGTAIGLSLLFNIPLLIGVIITGFDTLLFLVIQHYGIRKFEALILMLVSTMGICFGVEVFLAQPVWAHVATGLIPHLTPESLFVAIGMVGATVMPHNLYLHSSLVQTRIVEQTEVGKRQACRYNLWDTAIALNIAFFVNAAILVVAASVFFTRGIVVTEIQQAHELLTPLLGTTLASTLFSVALISSGQSSTLTGTLAGQIVMEGFIRLKVNPAARRLITRLIAIVPAICVIAIQGEEGTYGLLILSQVILSLQLPFAVIPLVRFTSDREKMGVFASKWWAQALGWLFAFIVVSLNTYLLIRTVSGWIADAGSNAIWLWVTAVPACVGVALFMVYVALPKKWRIQKVPVSPVLLVELVPQKYSRVGVALDYSAVDGKVLSHAQTIASQHGAVMFLFHVVQGVSGQLFGSQAYDDEARDDTERIEMIAGHLRKSGLTVETVLGYGNVPREIVRLSKENALDLLVMGGHGHTGLKDIFFGTAITKVRHKLPIPVLVVR
jgi:manganese transport protein